MDSGVVSTAVWGKAPTLVRWFDSNQKTGMEPLNGDLMQQDSEPNWSIMAKRDSSSKRKRVAGKKWGSKGFRQIIKYP